MIFLVFLHNKKIIYRDLKPQNILINKDGYLKLTDFGYAKKLQNKPKYETHTKVGTPEYMAPEIIMNKPYSFNIDYWSFGILIYKSWLDICTLHKM